jgi:hypothetical protein
MAFAASSAASGPGVSANKGYTSLLYFRISLMRQGISGPAILLSPSTIPSLDAAQKLALAQQTSESSKSSTISSDGTRAPTDIYAR